MNKKAPELPNIEDATLRACLAPLMEAMTAGSEPPGPPPPPASLARATRPENVPSGSNDNPSPAAFEIGSGDHGPSGTPETLAEWRSQADDERAAFRMADLFLAMTDAELASAAAEFPRQVAGTVAQIVLIKQRLAARYDKVTAAVALLERAQLRVTHDAASD